jgi:DNA repair exonuclease SbcCD ATPase subunit
MKYIEAPDLHFDPAWQGHFGKIIINIVNAAKKHDVAFIALPGDLYNRGIMASDKSGFNFLRSCIKQLTACCPVVAIHGTPSHEPPGSLRPLEDIGLTVLKPNTTYRLISGDIIKTSCSKYEPPECLLFGIPELNKKQVQKKLGLSAEEANAETVKQFYKYVTDYISEQRMIHPDVPAVCLFHGNMTDSDPENTTDKIMKMSDTVIHTEKLRECADITRWSLGHIHKPWESDKIFAGYAGYTGVDSSPWGNLDFQPAMNIVDLSNNTIKRENYYTPVRKKINKLPETLDPNVAYWLETEDDIKAFPGKVHPWSRITRKAERRESSRITETEYEQTKTLEDLFKLYDPKVKKSALKKIAGIPAELKNIKLTPIDVKIKSVEVSGCVLFKNKRMKIEIDKLSTGLNVIDGSNGAGKSSVLSFCSPYPVVIGKVTSSGRSSSIKDFFNSPESYIEKILEYNGQTHRHYITIRAAHTKSPKVECYFEVDGKSILDKGTFDEMLKECESRYGSLNDYILTSFYVQPQQGWKQESALMSASMTEIRDLVQNIAGINREQEKAYALNKCSELKTEKEKIHAWLTGVQDFQLDTAALEQEIDSLSSSLREAQEGTAELEASGKAVRVSIDNLEASLTQERARATRHDSLNCSLYSKKIEIENIDKQLHSAESEDVKKLEAELENVNSELDEQKKQQAEYEKQLTEHERYKLKQQERRLERQKCKSEIESLSMQIKSLVTKENDANNRIAEMTKGCENCGWVHPEREQKITELKNKQASTQAEIDKLVLERDNLKDKPLPPELPDKEPPSKPVLNIHELESDAVKIKNKILEAREFEKKTDELKSKKHHLQTDIDKIKAELETIDISRIPGLESELKELKHKREVILNDYQTELSKCTKFKTMIDDKIKALDRAKKTEAKIKTEKARLEKIESDLIDWNYIAVNLQSSKLPALELDLVLGVIDSEASKIIAQLDSGKYSFETQTQEQGKKGVVDRFNIVVHNKETGQSKSLLQHSPGEKAFFCDAYVKALVTQRNNRQHRNYEPVVIDEADAPIAPDRIAAYYSMQNNYWTQKVLTVTHNPQSHEYIQNHIDINNLLEEV